MTTIYIFDHSGCLNGKDFPHTLCLGFFTREATLASTVRSRFGNWYPTPYSTRLSAPILFLPFIAELLDKAFSLRFVDDTT